MNQAFARVAAHGITVTVEDSIRIAAARFPSHTEYFLTAQKDAAEPPVDLFGRVARWIGSKEAAAVSQDVFGLHRSEMEAIHASFPVVDWPITWLEQGAESKPWLAGTQVWAVQGLPVSTVWRAEEIVGRRFESEDVSYLRLGGALPETLTASREQQAQDIFRQFSDILARRQLTFRDVLRTWFYNDRITEWYAKFNEVRRDVFCEWQVYDHTVPASTGIGGSNGTDAALTAGLLAVGRDSTQVRAFAVPSPLQCPAIEYGSAFSRAVEVDAPDHRRLFLSGTASIDPRGETVHINDIDDQIDLTFRVASAILESRKMTWANVVRSLIYLKDAAFIEPYQAYARGAGFADLPALTVKNDICRDDLLFEIEFDAVAIK